jgi:GT2 family glycosyltransferase
MIRRQTYQEIGELDPNIFMYGEDIEWCMRARDHHWDIAIDPAAVITHLGSASSSSSRAIIGEAMGYLYIWSKHKPLWQRPLAKKLLQLGSLLRIWLFGTMVKRPHRAAVYKELWQSLAKA